MYDLTYFDKARQALEQATSIDEAKAIRDKSEAARIYARQIGASLEMQNMCCELKLRAERRMGELLGASPRQRPGEYQRSHDVTVAPTLADLGISKMQSSRWQAIARLPKRDFERFIDSGKEGGRELTSAAALKLSKQRDAQRALTPETEALSPNRAGLRNQLKSLFNPRHTSDAFLQTLHGLTVTRELGEQRVTTTAQ